MRVASRMTERVRDMLGDHRAPAGHQSQHAQPAAADGVRARALAGHARGARARARAAASPDRLLVLRRQARAQLRRFDRPHALSLHAGKPDQCGQARAGEACGHRARRSERPTEQREHEGAAQLALTVRDDGRGIDPATPPGFGMRGMQERVQALGGSYKVESDGGRGTSRAHRDPAARPTGRIGCDARNYRIAASRRHDQRSDHRRSPDRAAGLPAHAGGRRRRDRARSARSRPPAIASIAAIIPTW